MRIAILGTRGIPARYGGFETFAEELSTRLVLRGHEVTVYCRESYPEPRWRGVRLRYLSALRHKYLETLQHTFISTLDLLHHPQDVVLYCNAANALFTSLPRTAGMPVALNVDGIERHRKKWNLAARCWYLMSEALATFCPDEIVTDARCIRDYYRARYGRDSWFIPYGAPVGKVEPGPTLARLGLEPGSYFLYVSRLEPENNALMVRRAFEQLAAGLRLVLVGDAPYAPEYIRALKDTRDARILFPGAIYGDGYHELQSHSLAYVHATEVGGTHPALIEAMGRGALVLYLMTPENHEVAAGAGIPFSSQADLAAQMRAVLCMSETERQRLREAAFQRVRERYSWDAVTTSYERLFDHMLRGESGA
jgi:glycosyltransferase involved in cell wall biosynthesis